MVAPLMVSGVVNCIVYNSAFRVSVLSLGFVGATLVAYAVSMISAYGTWRFIQAKLN